MSDKADGAIPETFPGVTDEKVLETLRELPGALQWALHWFYSWGFADAPMAELRTQALGSTKQLRQAKSGLSKFGARDLSWNRNAIPVADGERLVMFCIRLGVAVGKVAGIWGRWSGPRGIYGETFARPLAEAASDRGEDYLLKLGKQIEAAWHHRGYPEEFLRYFDLFGLDPLPEGLYAQTWFRVADEQRQGEVTDMVDLSPDRVRPNLLVLSELSAPHREHVIPMFRFGTDIGAVTRSEALDTVLGLVAGAPGPGIRKEWIAELPGLELTDTEIHDRTDELMLILGMADAPTIEYLGTRMAAVIDDDALPDLVTMTLLTKPAKAKKAVFGTLQKRPVPAPETRGIIAALLADLREDSKLTKALDALDKAWGMDSAAAESAFSPEILEWTSTPQLWEVPHFDPGPATPENLAETAAAMSIRHDPLDVERCLATLLPVARINVDDAVAAFRGIYWTDWLKGDTWPGNWIIGGFVSSGVKDGLSTKPERPVEARDILVSFLYENLPVVLSMPSFVDMRITFTDLVDRLQIYADEGKDAVGADLTLALLRLDLATVTDALRNRLAEIAPIQLYGGSYTNFTAQDAVLDYLEHPVGEETVAGANRIRRTTSLAVRAEVLAGNDGTRPWRDVVDDDGALELWPNFLPALTGLPLRRITGRPRTHLRSPDYTDPTMGGLMLQAARRPVPFGAGGAVNMVSALRYPLEKTRETAWQAVQDAWSRGLLVPGVASTEMLDWEGTPGHFASFAEVLRDIAEQGMLPLAWAMLDDLTWYASGRNRIPAGIDVAVDVMGRLLPSVQAAVASGSVDASTVLELRGLRTLAQRKGTSKAVVQAREVVALAGPTPSSAADVETRLEVTASNNDDVFGSAAFKAWSFDDVWARDIHWDQSIADGTGDGVEVAFDELQNRFVKGEKYTVLYLTLPDDVGVRYVAIGAMKSLLVVRQTCDRETGTWLPEKPDPRKGRLELVAGERGEVLIKEPSYKGSFRGADHTDVNIPYIDVTATALLVKLRRLDKHSAAYGRGWMSELDINPAQVQRVVRRVLGYPLVGGQIVKALELFPDSLPVFWPILTEAVGYSADLVESGGKAPRWLSRVLDVCALSQPALEEAERRGLVPKGTASFPGLDKLAAAKGSAAGLKKARALVARFETEG
ncbi:MAG TPA: hypothetical protein H9870_02660 [Candidatus Corynebacterium avicola]|uniref:Uncharacterized protein n=1 Tax=Candidatus Corynebacterium avicola TaxID=2838527 RepID=A0A9D1RNC3_9CORY|nr:hypothetical protein [Candidatus Corynebacterium avicola]